MNEGLENLLSVLDEEIDKKCIELKKKHQEERNLRFFAYICAVVVIVPIVLIFTGINIISILLPVIFFFTIAVLLFSPIILSNEMGGVMQ